MSRKKHGKGAKWLRANLSKLLLGIVSISIASGVTFLILRKSPEDHLKAGKALQQSGNLKGASIELKNVLQSDPNNAEARFILGRIQFSNNQYQSAEKELSKAYKLGHKSDELPALLARSLLALKLPQRVLDEIKEIPGAAKETNATIFALRAQAHLLLKDAIAAEKDLAAANVLYPDHPDTLATKAGISFSKGDKEEALRLVKIAVDKASKRSDLWTLHGDLLRALNRKDEALSSYAKSLTLEPQNIHARLASAQIQLESGSLTVAGTTLKELSKYAPDNLMGRYMDALIDYRQGKHAEAKNKLQSVLRTAPNYPPANLLSAVVNLSLGNREEAKVNLNRVLEAMPDNALARKLMAATLMEMGQAKQAEEILTSLKNTGDDPMMSSLEGEVALRQGHFSEASKHLKKATDLAPGNPRLFMELASSRMGTGDTVGAIEALNKAAVLDTSTTKPETLLVLTHIKAKQFNEAFKAVDNLEKELPNSALAQNLRGTIHVARGDIGQARASFGKALQIDPGSFPAAANLARLDIQGKDLKSAQARFEQLLQHSPKESNAWVALANIAAMQKDENSVRKNLEQAKQADPKNPAPRHLLARYWLGKKDAGKALSEAREGLDATGRQEFEELIGISQVALGDNAKALATFAHWAEANPNNPNAHFRLAQVQSGAKDRAGAMKSLDKALALQPDFIEASLNKALLLSQEGRLDEGIKIARAVQAKLPKKAAGYLVEADILYSGKKFTDSAKLYVKSAQMLGQSQPLVRAFNAFSAAGQPEEAEKALRQWLLSHPNDTLVHHQLAVALLNSNRLKEAEEHYGYLARSNPKDLAALNNLAWLQGELRNPAALTTAEQAFRLSPDNPATMDTLGWLLVNAGQNQRGLEILKKALSKAPDSPEIHWHLAAALAKSGDRVRAKQELERLFASGLAFRQENEAKKLLDSLR